MTELLAIIRILLVNLPALVKLIDEIERTRAGHAIDERVASDKRRIEQAFKNRDAAALRRVFNGLSDP